MKKVSSGISEGGLFFGAVHRNIGRYRIPISILFRICPWGVLSLLRVFYVAQRSSEAGGRYSVSRISSSLSWADRASSHISCLMVNGKCIRGCTMLEDCPVTLVWAELHWIISDMDHGWFVVSYAVCSFLLAIGMSDSDMIQSLCICWAFPHWCRIFCHRVAKCWGRCS